MKYGYLFLLSFITIAATAQNPLIVKSVGSSVLEPANKDQNEWQNNLWNGKRFYQGTGSPLKLCVTDGTTAGTIFVADLGTSDAGIINIIPAKDFVYISTNRLITTPSFQVVTELWRSDGTAAGTALVKSFEAHSFSTSGSNFTSDAINTFNYSVDGNLMYFAGYSSVNGQEPWKTDGTPGGTNMIKDIKPGAGPSYAGGFSKIGNTVTFSAASVGFGTTLWKTDGTEAGTVDLAVPGLTRVAPSARVNNKVIFYGSNPENGFEPWVSDGTVAGTFRLADINAGTGNSTTTAVQNLHLRFNDKYAFFIAQSGNNVKNLWRTDGTVAGTIKLTQDGLINEENFGGGGYSVIDDNGLWWIGANNVLYFSNGMPDGTRKVTSSLSNAIYMCLYKGAAWFHARNADRVSNAEPYRSDGTAAGTNLALEVTAGQTGSGPYGFFELNNNLYFFASNFTPNVGTTRNLYRYNGDMIFNGSVAGNNWKDSANWNSLMPPGITDTAYINTGFGVNVNGRNAFAGTLIMQSGSSVTLSSANDSLFVHKNLQGTSATGNGTIVFRNFNGDTVNLNNAFSGFNVNVNGVVSINGNLTVNANLNLTNNARLLANNNNVVLAGTTSNITNAANNYIVTNAIGKLQIENIGTGGRTGNVVFPIGSSANYNPVTFSNSGTPDAFGARTQPGIQSSYTGETATGGNYTMGAVNNTWFITEATGGGSNANITLQWNASQELPGFNRMQSSFAHYTSGNWVLSPSLAATGTNPYTVSGTGITSFSPFGVMNSSASLPIYNVQLSVKKSSRGNYCSWTIYADNAEEVTLERSFDGRQFGDVYNAKFSSTGFYEDNFSTGKTYYRLKVADRNGLVKYSNIVVINTNKNSSLVTVYPTIFVRSFTVQNNGKEAELSLYNAGGSLVLRRKLTEGTNHIAADQLQSGIYFYQLLREGKMIGNGKLTRF